MYRKKIIEVYVKDEMKKKNETNKNLSNNSNLEHLITFVLIRFVSIWVVVFLVIEVVVVIVERSLFGVIVLVVTHRLENIFVYEAITIEVAVYNLRDK